MQSDIALKVLTQRCAEDLLPLFDAEQDTVLGVETLELPASQTRLDNVLHLRSPGGQEYLHLIEWQGYRDPDLLWRLLGYLVGVARQRPERPLLATVVYLTPEADVGAVLNQRLTDGRGWTMQVQAVRLWEMDAALAVATGPPGLVALAPLMRGMTAPLVEQAAQRLIEEVALVHQSELLTALGLLSVQIIGKERFVQMVTRERMAGNELIQYLFAEELKEVEVRAEARADTRLREAEARLRAGEAQAREAETQRFVRDALFARFPDAPIRVLGQLEQISDPQRLLALHHAILTATDVAAVEAALAPQAG